MRRFIFILPIILLISCQKIELRTYIERMTDFENIIYVSIDTGNDSNRGTLSEPLKTIQTGIDMAAGYIADGLAESVDVYVAEGRYEVDSSTDGSVTMADGVSLYGGYKIDFSERDIKTYETEIADLGTTGEINSAVVYLNGSSDLNVLNGFTIYGGDSVTDGGWSFTVRIENSSLTISNNRIIGGSAPVTGTSVGINLYNGGNSVIEDNYIYGGISTGLNIGILAAENITTIIQRNEIYRGTSGRGSGIYIMDANATILNNTIDAGGGSDICGVNVPSGSIVGIEDNRIFGGSATENSRGIIIRSNNVTVSGNTISGGTSTSAIAGIYCQAIDWTIIRNNAIFGGNFIGTGDEHDANAISLHDAGAQIYNNTIAGGVSHWSTAVLCRDGSSPHIENNILFSLADTEGVCVYESSTNGDYSHSIGNNNFYDFSGNTILYRPHTEVSLDTRGVINALDHASGNWDADPLFVDIDGPDGDITTMEDNDWRLKADSPVEVRQGGLDGIQQGWGFGMDLNGAVRTNLSAGPDNSPANDGAGGWSMGAYERD